MLRKPGQADLETIADPMLTDTNVLLAAELNRQKSTMRLTKGQ